MDEKRLDGQECTDQWECSDRQEGPEEQDWKGKDPVLLNDVAPQSSHFYDGVNITKLEDEEFETFWQELARKNRSAFSSDGQTLGTETPFGLRFLQPEIPYEQAKERIAKLLACRPMRKQVYRRTLAACSQRLEFSQVEALVADFPEFASCGQSPYRFIRALEEAGGLRLIAVDSEGNVISPERVEGLSEDEIDDLVDRFELEASKAGTEAAEALSPKQLLDDLVRAFPDRIGVYKDLLAHIKANPCKYDDIERLLSGRDFSAIRTLGTEKHVAIKPSVFVDNMEKAGGIVWRDRSWHVTKEGEALLEKLLTQ